MIWRHDYLVIKIDKERWDNKIGRVLKSAKIDKNGDVILRYLLEASRRLSNMKRAIIKLEEQNNILRRQRKQHERNKRKYEKKLGQKRSELEDLRWT